MTDVTNDHLNLSEEEKKNIPSQIPARKKIIEILGKIETRQAFTDKVLENELKDFTGPDRDLITEVVYGVMRWMYRLDWFLQHLYVGKFEDLIPDVRNNLRSSLYQLMYLDRIPAYAVLNEAVEIAKTQFNQKTANLVNAILRNYLRQQKKLEYLELQLDVVERLAVHYSHPRWLVQRWIEYWGIDEVTQLLQKNNQRPRLYVRVNHLKTNQRQVIETLEQHNVPYEIHEDFPEFIWIKDFSRFRQLNLLKDGWVSVQDVSTGLPVKLLQPQPGERVLDMCAAPGGKAGYIGEYLHGRGFLLCVDRHVHRSRMLKDNLRRWGIENACVVNADATQLPINATFDKILLDAPCSGLGVLGKRADLKWKRTEQDIMNMQQLQLHLLDVAAEHLKPGGALVYSTCTIEPEENEKVVEKFLQTHPEFELTSLLEFVPIKYLWDAYHLRTFPHKHEMDGTFAVRLEKKK